MSIQNTRDLDLEVESTSGGSMPDSVKLRSTNPNLEASGGLDKYELKSIRKSFAVLRSGPPNSDLILNVGTSLFNLLPVSIAQLIENEYRLAKANQHNLRIKIITKTPGLIDLPWELLCKPPNDFLAVQDKVSITRYVPALFSYPPLLLRGPLRILFVLTNPKDEYPMRSDLELDAVSRSIINNSSIKMDVLSEPTAEAFRRKLLEGQYHIVHYIGHGGISRGEGNLILHDYSDRSYWLNQNELADILPPSVQLLCLSTCFTAKNYEIKAFNRLGQTWVRH